MRFARRIDVSDVDAGVAAVRDALEIGFDRIWLAGRGAVDPRMVVGAVNTAGVPCVLEVDPTDDASVPAGLPLELAVEASGGWRDSLRAMLAAAPYDPPPAVWALVGDVAGVAAAGHLGIGAAFEALDQAEDAEEWVAEYESELTGGSFDPIASTINAATAVFLDAGEDPDALIGLIERYREVGVDHVVLGGASAGDPEFMAVVMAEFDDDEVRAGAGEREARRAEAVAAYRARVATPVESDSERPVRKRSRRSGGMAKRIAAWQKAAVSRMSDRQLEVIVGNRIGVRVLFHATARMYQPSKAGDFTGPIEFTLETPHGPEVWTIDCSPNGAKARRGESPGAAMRLDAGLANFLRVGVGEVSAPSAVLAGKLNIRGDFGLALKVGEMFGGPSLT